MKVYLVMLDKWWCFGDSYDNQWSSCDILGIYTSFEDAKKKLVEQRLKILDEDQDVSENNFYEFLKNADEDYTETFNKWYKDKSLLTEVLAHSLRYFDAAGYTIDDYIYDYTYFFYILEKEVE